MKQAQNFENSILAGRDDSKGGSPVAEASTDQTDQQIDNEPESPAPEETAKYESPEVEGPEIDQDSEENQKYIKVLKHYFGFSKFRG